MRPQSTTPCAIPVTCPGCGELFFRYPSVSQRCCSKACAARLRTLPIDVRFWANVQKIGNPKGCWLWLLRPNKGGYGVMVAKGAAPETIYVHRYSYELHIGTIPKGLDVCHTCDVRTCVNPAHFFLGTHADNLADMVAKGRQSRGESHGFTKLTEDQAREIRARHAAGGVTQRRLAREYGISWRSVNDLVLRKTWKHVA